MSVRKYSEFNVVAFGYYDGPTEGIATAFGVGSRYYFKLIAWDGNQDERLYVTTTVDSRTYDRLIMLLSTHQPQQLTRVWIPDWVFRSDAHELEAENIISACRESLEGSTSFLLGTCANGLTATAVSVEGRAAELSRLIYANKPDDLAVWRPSIRPQPV